MDPTPTHILLGLLGLLAYMLVTCTLLTLAGRVRQQRSRHDLIVASRRRRREYLEAIAVRMGEMAEGDEVTEAEPAAESPFEAAPEETEQPDRAAA